LNWRMTASIRITRSVKGRHQYPDRSLPGGHPERTSYANGELGRMGTGMGD
jgi:hypothetical protein